MGVAMAMMKMKMKTMMMGRLVKTLECYLTILPMVSGILLAWILTQSQVIYGIQKMISMIMTRLILCYRVLTVVGLIYRDRLQDQRTRTLTWKTTWWTLMEEGSIETQNLHGIA